MLIGFCCDSAKPAAAPADSDLLQDAGCARIFHAEHSDVVTSDVIDYLRPGDVLVVANVMRLANSIEGLLALVDRLHQDGIAVQSVRDQVSPGTPEGDAFGTICALLAEFCRQTEATERGKRLRKTGRGRPIALTPENQERAERLLRRNTVAQVAKLLRVSPATIYRYFPRRRVPAKPGPATGSGDTDSHGQDSMLA